MHIRAIVLLGLVFVLLFLPVHSFANKSSVKIEAPQSAEKGSEIVIKIHVSHEGNNFIHHTNRVDVKINGKLIKSWEFTARKRPETENFTREVTYTLTGPITVTAEANCNIHGSEGPATWTIAVKQKTP